MILREMANILVAGGFGTLGRNIFIHHMPAEVEIGILFRDQMPGDRIDREIKGIRRGGFQVVVRQPDYDDTLARQIAEALSIEAQVIQGLDVKYILPRSEPFVYPATDGKNIEYSVNFDAVYAKT